MNVKTGDTVWFCDYSGVSSGEVIDTMKGLCGSQHVACVKTRDSYKTLSIDSREMWTTPQQATLALAEKKQQEAARLLTSAADLFKRAGGMKEDAEAPAEVS